MNSNKFLNHFYKFKFHFIFIFINFSFLLFKTRSVITSEISRLSNVLLFYENNFTNIISFLENDNILKLYNKRNNQRIFLYLNLNEKKFFNYSSLNYSQIYKKNIYNNSKITLYYTTESRFRINYNLKKNSEKVYYYIIIENNKTYQNKIDCNYNYNLSDISIHKNYLKILPNYKIESQISSSLNYIDNKNNTNYLIFITITNNMGNYYLSLMKYIFYEKQNIIKLDFISYQNYISSKGKIVSCFLSKKNIISCLYLNFEKKYTISLFDINLILKNNLILKYSNDFKEEDDFYFFKSIHLKNEIGIYLFFSGKSNNIPTILIKDFSNIYQINNFIDLIEDIKLYDYEFNNDILLNDLISISSQRFCYISTTKNKDNFILSFFSIYNNDKKLSIKYYLIKILEYNYYKDLSSLKISLYNNYFLALDSNFYINEYNNKNDKIYSSLILFNYPTIKNVNDDMIQILIEKNEVIINLFETIDIENNIFGYEIKNIKITNTNCKDFILISNKNGKKLEKNILDKDEKIKILITNDNYSKRNCNIEYKLIINEPPFYKIKKYADKINISYGDYFEEKYYSPTNYIGRIGYYNLSLNKDLTKKCINNNCKLCLLEKMSICIVCNNIYSLSKDIKNNIKKYCINDNDIKSNKKRRTQVGGGGRGGRIGGGSGGRPGGGPRNPPKIINGTVLDEKDNNNEETNIYINSEEQIEMPKEEQKSTSLSEEMNENWKNSDEVNIINDHKNIEDSNEKIKHEIKNTNEINIKTDEIEKNTDMKQEDENTSKLTMKINQFEQKCSKEEILNNSCIKIIDNEQISLIYNSLQKELVDNGYEKQKVIHTENTIFQISSLEEQKNDENIDISSIDLGECEDKLRKKYEISENEELIILKVDIKYDITTYIQYEVYDPITLVKLDLNECKDTQISIDLPVNLDTNIETLYDSLEESGYNLFDLNDSFYNDICSKYTTINGTDITINDRKLDIYDKTANLSFCQKGCTFQAYNSENKKAKCNCQAKTADIQINFDNITFSKNIIINHLFATIKNSNFKVLKCYKLLFDIDNLIYNIGCIIMTIIYISLLISFIVYCFSGKNNINYFIQLILIKKVNSYKNNINKNKKINKNNNLNITKKRNKSCIIINYPKNKINKNSNDKKEKIEKKKLKLNDNKKSNNKKLKDIKNKNIQRKSKKIQNYPPKRKRLINKLINKSSSLSSSEANSNLKMSNYKLLESSKKTSKCKLSIDIPLIDDKNKKDNNISKKNKDYSNNDKFKYQFLNEQELNNLDYKKALNQDKRTYLEYYYSLLIGNILL